MSYAHIRVHCTIGQIVKNNNIYNKIGPPFVFVIVELLLFSVAVDAICAKQFRFAANIPN